MTNYICHYEAGMCVLCGVCMCARCYGTCIGDKDAYGPICPCTEHRETGEKSD